MKNLVTFARALADGTRWRILRLVADEALCVCELADILGMPPSSVSSHVQIIRKAGLLESEKCGKWTYFRASRERRELLRLLEAAFAAGPDATRTKDEAKRAKRLAVRAGSCCPGPKRLLKP